MTPTAAAPRHGRAVAASRPNLFPVWTDAPDLRGTLDGGRRTAVTGRPLVRFSLVNGMGVATEIRSTARP